jgi:diaminopimelate decarboxylase
MRTLPNSNRFEGINTPFYYYDIDLLRQTLKAISDESSKYDYKVHYAVKANANSRLLEEICNAGFGVDCVSGNEVQKAVDMGFDSSKIVFAGVGKSDWEINIGLDNKISCFNVESIPELEIINELAAAKGQTANIALRINPNVNAHTHHYITTGLEENKFGINMGDLEKVISVMSSLNNVKFHGLHFHIGSQITDMHTFQELCVRVNEIQQWFISRQLFPRIINVGGGLGVDYHNPDEAPMPDFAAYFGLFNSFLDLKPGQELHFELGRAVVAQCGTLISKVLYVKEGMNTDFAIIDAGMNDLIRPALYQAFHKIENISSTGDEQKYDVVGPVCESSDCFGKAVMLPKTKRGDYIAIRTAGAYGEVMASQYNLRKFAVSVYSDKLK